MMKISILKIFYTTWPFLLFACAPYSLPPEKTYSTKETALTYYSQSQDLYQSGNYTQALERIDSAIVIHQNFAQFYQLKGDILRKLNLYDPALQAYLAAISQRSNYTEVYISIAEIYHQQNHYHESIRYYRKALAVDTTLTPLYLEIASNYFALQEWDITLNILEDYRKQSLALGQELHPDYYYLKGKVLFNQKNYLQAIRNLLEYRTGKKAYSQVQALLGQSYYALEDFDEGLKHFNILVRLEPERGEWYYYRGVYFYHKNNMEDANNQFRMALKYDQTLYNCHYYLGKIFERAGDDRSAVEEFRLYRESMREQDHLGIESDEIKELKSHELNDK